MTENDRKRRWLEDYLAALPDHLRTTPDDALLKDAARIAYSNGWTPARLAAAVAGASYSHARHPSRVAIDRMARIGATAPRAATRNTRCCPDLSCDRPTTALGKTAYNERWSLIRELGHTHDLTDDEREECMTALIADQRLRGIA